MTELGRSIRVRFCVDRCACTDGSATVVPVYSQRLALRRLRTGRLQTVKLVRRQDIVITHHFRNAPPHSCLFLAVLDPCIHTHTCTLSAPCSGLLTPHHAHYGCQHDRKQQFEYGPTLCNSRDTEMQAYICAISGLFSCLTR
jgi:hypothetical protein